MKMIECKVCGSLYEPNLNNHTVVRDDTKIGLSMAFREKQEPSLYDSYDCPYCGRQYIAGKRLREADEAKHEESDEDMAEDEKPQDEQISSSEDGINSDDLADIKKKIEEAGDER